ncbi:MAG: hypothetical protein ACI4JF_05725 [Oscillospiraceae bacterium]
MKKAVSVILTVIMCIFALSSCSKEEAAAEISDYTGILTKVKLGMPLTKIVSMQPDGVELYYEDDTTIWSVNPDTDLMEVRDLIPADDLYYYADDSIITYKFRTVKGDSEIYLNGYTEEVHCLMDRAAAEEYFYKKTDELVNKHCVDEGSSAIGTMVGTEGIDMELVYTQNISASSYDVVFTMTLTYDTVNSVDGYYATEFDISLTEKAVKTSVPITTTAKSKSKDEQTEDSEEKEEE